MTNLHRQLSTLNIPLLERIGLRADYLKLIIDALISRLNNIFCEQFLNIFWIVIIISVLFIQVVRNSAKIARQHLNVVSTKY